MMNFNFKKKNRPTEGVKRSSMLSNIAAVVSLLVVQTSCEAPFEGVTAILTNNLVDKIITVQVVDANPDAENPYPENLSVTVSGTAVDQGLVYYSDGSPLGGGLELVNNTVNLAIRPNTEIISGQSLKFNVIAEAEGYLSNSIAVTVDANDDFIYAELNLVNLSALPKGVVAKNASSTDFDQDVPLNDIIVLVEDESSVPDESLKARLTFKKGTILKDEDGNNISGNELTAQITYFNGIEDDAVLSATGGKGNIVLEDGSIAIVNGMVDVNAFLNGKKIKSFSNSVIVDIFLESNSFNPKTNASYKVGDEVTIISRSKAGDEFVNEGKASLVLDESTQRLKVSFNATHFSVFGAVELYESITDGGNDKGDDNVGEKDLYEYQFRYKSNGQLFAWGGGYSHTAEALLKRLSSNIPDVKSDFVLEIYLFGALRVKKTFSSGDSIIIVPTDLLENPSPMDKLNFELQTKCTDGTFLYTGPIQYRLSGTGKWLTFSNAADGLLTTRLLDWGKTYDFRVTYKGESFVRTKAVIKSHFRKNDNNSYDYWGPDATKKTFFSAPIGCGG